MDEAGLLAAIGQRVGEAVHVAGLAAAALARQAGRLVDRDQVLVAPQHGGAHHRGVGVRDPQGLRGRRLPGLGQGRDAHGLAGLHAGRGLGPPAVHAQLAASAHALDAPLGEVREAPAQEAVEPLVPLAGLHREGLHAAHASPLAAQAPIASAPIESPTDSPT